MSDFTEMTDAPINPFLVNRLDRQLEAMGQLLSQGGDRRTWAGHSMVHHIAKAMSHISRHQYGEVVDPDSGRSALIHAALRLLMAAQREADK